MNYELRIKNTAGQLLRSTRIAKGLTIQDIEKRTKIRFKFLQALEDDNYTLLPSPVYARGFIKNYSTVLRLDVEKVLALYRRQVDEQKRYKAPPKELTEPLSRSIFHLTPNKVIGVVVGLLLAGIVGYFFLQYQRLFQPPHLLVEQPQEGAKVQELQVNVLGTTDSDATIVVNNATVLVRDEGRFFETVQLQDGPNTITIEAISRRGKKTTLKRTVTVVTGG